MATAARIEDVSLHASGTLDAEADSVGLVVARNLHVGMLVVLPLGAANGRTTRQVFETSDQTEIWRISYLGTTPLGVEYMEMARVLRFDGEGMTRVSQPTRRFAMRSRVLTPEGHLATLINNWTTAQALEPLVEGKFVASTPTIGVKRNGLGVLGSQRNDPVEPTGQMDDTVATRSPSEALLAMQQFLSSPMGVASTPVPHKETTHELPGLPKPLDASQQRGDTALTKTPPTFPPAEAMIPLSALKEIFLSFKGDGAEPRGRDRDTGFEAYTLDGAKWTCTIKGQGPTRMLKVNGPLRAMGEIRAGVIFKDLLLDARGYQVILGMISSRQSGMVSMPRGFNSMERLDVIWPLPWLEDITKLESFLLMGE